MRVIPTGAGHGAGRDGRYVEHLRVPDLSLGSYVLPVGSRDDQQPHTEDEVYVVVRGAARLWTPDETIPVVPGSVVFVPAGEEHRFVDVTDELEVLVVFGPAERTRAGGAGAAGGRS